MKNHAERLRQAITTATGDESVCLSIGVLGQADTVRVTPPSAAATATVNAFDWSDEAHDAWLEDRQPERKSLKQSASQAITDNLAFLADATVTQAEAVAQVKALTRQVNRIIALLAKD